ncbi:hypothetical protein [Lacticaseibacillus zhaodongensis]|uniref:hypothetical protein n=1 Tax=Lacticaseibacillus zhaodongensis TaxID=2668065 RepID=UPI0012D36EBB|nr:hypothetical protein [Lacticaseibacillus zhaodongensis]
MKKSATITTALLAAMLAVGAATQVSFSGTSASQTVQAVSNIRQRESYAARSNATINTHGAKGIANNRYSHSNFKPKTYKVTAGSKKGAKWSTALYLPTKTIRSNNNPSHKTQSYFAGSPAEGYTMDKSGNMYFAFSRRNGNASKTGYLYNGYIMRLDTYAIKKLKSNKNLLSSNPQSLIKGNHVRFSNLDSAFCSGSLAYDRKTNKIKFMVAYSNGSDSFLSRHPVQLATVNPNSLRRESTAKFYLQDPVTHHYTAPNVLAFDNSGNFYAAAAASLTTTHGTAYIIQQGVRKSNGSYSFRQLGMTIKPVLSTQLQGISIDNDRFYITSNSAYVSFSLSKYLQNAETPAKAGSANSWLGLETAQLSGAREVENLAAHNGAKYMVMTYPSEVVQAH